jgi:hypothetical protein
VKVNGGSWAQIASFCAHGVSPVGRGIFLSLLTNQVYVGGRSVVDGPAINSPIGAIEWGDGSLFRPSPGRLAAWWRLAVSHGSFLWSFNDFRNVDRFYHIPIIGSIAPDL